MSHESDGKLARITPVDSQYAGNALTTWNCLWLWITCFMVTVTVVSAAIAFAFTVVIVSTRSVLLALVGVVLVYVAELSVLLRWTSLFEWPFDRWLCNRLLKVVELTAPPVISPFDSQTRIVELVPRERWGKIRFDTATDLMMLRVDDEGVWMKGDYFCYEIPCESILSAETYPLEPGSGGPTRVLIYARTEQKTVELPISYRDYGLDALRRRERSIQIVALAEQINSIAKGCQYTPLTDSEAPQELTLSRNPYAAPAM